MATSRLTACPASPNCVSSDAADRRHAVAPLSLAMPAAEAWRRVQAAVRAMPRTTIVDEAGGYLHAECRSAVFAFIDDLELELRAEDGLVAVRSAARLGRYDFGVNRRRVEALRRTLKQTNAIR